MGTKILVVDDQPGIRLLLQEILKTEGYETITAKTGKEACERAVRDQPSLIIMDYNLPVMHGRDVLQYLEKEDISIPVLVITGDSREAVAKELTNPFVRDVVSKPFDIHHLKDMVAGALTHSG